jgi:hypothetical protein
MALDQKDPNRIHQKFQMKNRNKSLFNTKKFPEKYNWVSGSKTQSETRQNKNILPHRMLKTVIPEIFPDLEIQKEILEKSEYALHLESTKGPEFAINYLKATKACVWTLLSKDKFVNPGYAKISIGLDKTGWPKWLGPRLKRKVLVNRDIQAIRAVMTIIATQKLITYHSKTTLSSITKDTGLKNSNNLMLRKPVDRIIRRLGKRFIRRPQMKSNVLSVDESQILDNRAKLENSFEPHYKWSMKSSPNGISFFSLLIDIVAIRMDGTLFKLLNWSRTYYDTETVNNWFDEAVGYYSDLRVPSFPVSTGKISATQESGKTKPRIFAIVDTITQTLLSDFHDDLMGLLKTIPEDCTFNHGKVREMAAYHHGLAQPFYGYADLSDATDSIPISVYRDIGNLLRPNLGTTWVELFTRSFSLSKSVKSHMDKNTIQLLGDSVTYNTGQPMGALSSWPFMALLQHILIWNAFGSRKSAKGKYLVLGDDIVIFDEKAYKKYLSFLDQLRVPYTNDFSTIGFEFAKRYFLNGREITGVYLSALYANRNDPYIFAITYRNLIDRGYCINPSLPKSFYRYLKVSNKRIKEINLIMLVPFGTDISPECGHRFLCHILGNSWCHYEHKTISDEYVKILTDLARVVLRHQMTKEITEYKRIIPQIVSDFEKYFDKYNPELIDYCPVSVERIKDVFQESRRYNIRLLERDYKNLFLHGQMGTREALRPKLPDIPYSIDFDYERDKVRRTIKHRYGYHLNLISYLRS